MSGGGDVLDLVRARCARVMQRPAFVRIEQDRIAPYALSLPLETLPAPELDRSSHFIGGREPTVAFFITLDAINFGSGYFPHLSKLPGKSGYFTVATRLTEHFQEFGEISPAELSAFDAARCREIFRQPADSGPLDELMGLFAQALADLGKLLLERYAGSFVNLVAAAERSAARLVEILSAMPFFRDVHRYDDFDVPFYKRAQLTAADLSLALPADELGRFDDLNRLTIFADNLVPHVLRCDGILQYHPELARAIDAGQLIPARSPEETEIRAAAVHASELIVQALRDAGKSISPMRLDYLLWNRGQRPEYKARPRHRARSVFY